VPQEVADYREREQIDLDTSFAQLATAAANKPLAELPLVVISRGESHLDPANSPVELGLPEDFPLDFIESAWQDGQAYLASLMPDAKHVIAAKSAHYVQLDEPELVIEAVETVIDAVRDPSN
jgi:pimeloyl-ACP methyl ester carboxylesterase